MSESERIPELTPEERALATQAERAEYMPMATALRYIHWNKARAELLDAIAEQGHQLVLVSEKGVNGC